MQILSVPEFGKFCEELKPSCYVYATDNQRRNAANNTLKVVARYKIMVISLNPNSICFKSDTTCLCFECVKRVHVNPEICSVGTVFTIVCGNRDDSSKDISYTLIAD